MTVEEIIHQLKTDSINVDFSIIIKVIDTYYNFREVEFSNGDTINHAGQNNGSCKLFSFAKLNNLNQGETLACFGSYYRNDVLKFPEAIDHQNIRNFMIHSWDGIQFKDQALRLKA